MTTILGLSTFCDASAAIVQDGKIICAVEEERLNRQKHYDGIPWLSISECLEISGLAFEDIDIIAIGWNPLLGWGTRIAQTCISIFRTPAFFKGKLRRGNDYLDRCKEIFRLRRCLRKKFAGNDIRQKIIYVQHHLAHAASTFLVSPYEKANIIIADGIGEKSAISLFSGEKNSLKYIREIKFPHSLGHLYATVTGFLGFRMVYDEGKVMALAAFGEDAYADLFSRLIHINHRNKSITLDTRLLDYHAARNNFFPKKLIELAGIPPRKENELLTQQHKNLAHSLQKCLEKSVLALLEMYFPKNDVTPLCGAGGLFFNSVLNGKIISRYARNYFIPPAAGDNGVSAGAALYCNARLDKNFQRNTMENAYLGRSFETKEIISALKKHRISYRESDNIFVDTAKLIVQDNITGWYRGRMEFGPRALGNRSILARPDNKAIKDILNAKVKHRERFRPFACSVLTEEKDSYFENAQESPFMLKVYNFKKEYKNRFPAITHINNSCRIQTVSRRQNPEFYSLLVEIKKLTGFGIVLNTSMNVAGEPIINTPDEAIELIKKTHLDILVMGNYIIKKVKL